MAESKWPWVQEHMGLIADWVRNGATDKDVMERIGVCHTTFYQYKKMYPEFADLLKRTKDVVDSEVENALLQKAVGFVRTLKKVTIDRQTGQPIPYEEEVYFPPDTTAQIFWLKNRRQEQWRDRRELDVQGQLGVKKLEDWVGDEGK